MKRREDPLLENIPLAAADIGDPLIAPQFVSIQEVVRTVSLKKVNRCTVGSRVEGRPLRLRPQAV
jgi:hypothetical protein